MKRMTFSGAICGLLLLAGPWASAKSSKEILTIRIHGEGSAEDGDKFTTPVALLDGRKAYLSIMPLLTEHEVKAVCPFKTPDGSGGAYLRLDNHGANLLTQYCLEKRGSMLVVLINGRQVVDVLVDTVVKDGIFVIPSGMTMAEEARLVNAFPLMGQENSAAQKKKKQSSSPRNIMLPPKASDLEKASVPTAPREVAP
jgi:hypothetical protein